MGVKHHLAPWWLTWVVVGGLVALFLGERVLADVGVARAIATGVGTLMLVGATVWRFFSFRASTGETRRVERLLLLTYVGCVVAVLGVVASSEDGMRLLRIEFSDPQAETRYEVIVQVLAAIVLTASILPALGAQWALGAQRHAGAAALEVESLRVRETATGGLSVAFACAFLFLAGYLSSQRDKSVDLSYFKTASPGTATQEIVRTLGDPLRVLVFFPEVNAVKDEVMAYFRQLADATGNVQVDAFDRMISPQVAREYRVGADGTILLLRGEQTGRLTVSTQLGVARARLRTLDAQVQEQLLQLARGRRTAYLVTGHDELNAPAPEDAAGDDELLRGTTALRELLRVLNYRVEDLGLQQGLGREVPEDAAMVLVLGPRRPFLNEELDALDRYLQGGGSLLLALEPQSEFRMGPLERRLNIRYRSVQLADDRQHVRRRGNVSDRQLIVTDRFSAHEAVTTLSRSRVGSGILLVGAGHVEAVGDSAPRPSFVVRSLPTTFADVNGNYEFDQGSEARSIYNLVAAVEATLSDRLQEAGAPDSGDGGRMRALVYTDAEMFSDAVLASVGLNVALLADGLRWLGGEESFSGETQSEEDVAIVHTKAEDVAWFYSTILGAPLLVLVLGVVTVVRRRQRSGGS